MRFCVLREMITPHETLTADATNVAFLTRMRAIMPCEFVRASKLFLAASPSAMKRAFSRVRTEVCFQMTALAVFFIATVVVASVNFLFLFASPA